MRYLLHTITFDSDKKSAVQVKWKYWTLINKIKNDNGESNLIFGLIILYAVSSTLWSVSYHYLNLNSIASNVILETYEFLQTAWYFVNIKLLDKIKF